MSMMRIKKGDRVVVISGDDTGKRGEVLRVFSKEGRVLIQGVNMVTRHQRQTASQEGGRLQKEAPIHVSNVAHIDPKTDKPTKIGTKILEDGRKVRYAKRSGEVIDR